jgi:hypothetical protein
VKRDGTKGSEKETRCDVFFCSPEERRTVAEIGPCQSSLIRRSLGSWSIVKTVVIVVSLASGVVKAVNKKGVVGKTVEIKSGMSACRHSPAKIIG